MNTPTRNELLAILKLAFPQATNKDWKEFKKPDLEWLMEVAKHFPTGGRGMSETLLRYRQNYQPTICYSGRKSLNNGDAIAEFLEGKEPIEVITEAERILGLEDGFLLGKYGHLNPGQQRMNSGNRLRAALKRGDITTDDLH